MFCLIFFSILSLNVATKKIILNGTFTVKLNTDEIIFLETPNFPKLVNPKFQITFIAQNYQSVEVSNIYEKIKVKLNIFANSSSLKFLEFAMVFFRWY